SPLSRGGRSVREDDDLWGCAACLRSASAAKPSVDGGEAAALALQPLGGGAGRHRAPEQVALAVLAAEAAEDVSLLLGLDTLGDHGDAEIVAKADDAAHQLEVALALSHAADEEAVDLEHVDREA